MELVSSNCELLQDVVATCCWNNGKVTHAKTFDSKTPYKPPSRQMMYKEKFGWQERTRKIRTFLPVLDGKDRDYYNGPRFPLNPKVSKGAGGKGVKGGGGGGS